jgi:hypothetical protein
MNESAVETIAGMERLGKKSQNLLLHLIRFLEKTNRSDENACLMK